MTFLARACIIVEAKEGQDMPEFIAAVVIVVLVPVQVWLVAAFITKEG